MGPWFRLFLKWEYSWKDPVRGVSEEICSTGPTGGGVGGGPCSVGGSHGLLY